MECDSQHVGGCARFFFFLNSSCNSSCPSCCSHFRSGGTCQQVGCWLTDEETDPWAGFMRNVVVARNSWKNVGQKATTPLILIAGSTCKPKRHKYLSTFLPKHSWDYFFFFPKIWYFVSNWLQIYVDRVGISLCGNSSFGSDNLCLTRVTRLSLAIYHCLYSRWPFQTVMKIFGLCYLGFASCCNLNTYFI